MEIDYYSNELEINKYDIKKNWKILRNIIGKKSDKNKQKNIFSINNKIISNSQVIAEEFNNFFVSIGPQLASNIYSSTNHMSYMNTAVNSIFLPDITTIEVINVILLLKNSCAGWDDIPAYVMKRCRNVYIELLTHIIDKSIKEGVFPSELKLAKVVPIFKYGDSSKITNYRPTSVLSFFSKVVERVMYNHITNYHSYMNTVVNSIFIPDITTIEVINVILLLKNSCAGWDDIPAYVMKRWFR